MLPSLDNALGLPIEILQHILRNFDYPELLAVSHVCKLWRVNAFDSPTYWRDITITKYSHTVYGVALERNHELELFKNRVLHADAANLNITVHAYALEFYDALSSFMMQHLHRVVRLSVLFTSPLRLADWMRMPIILRKMLMQPAPALVAFSLFVGSRLDAEMTDFIPKSGVLRTLHFANVSMSRHTSLAYPSIATVTVQSEEWYPLPANLFALFPCIQTLNIASNMLLLEKHFNPPPPETLTALTIEGWDDIAAVLTAMGEHVARMPLVRWTTCYDKIYTERGVTALLEHLTSAGNEYLSCSVSYPDCNDYAILFSYSSIEGVGRAQMRRREVIVDTEDDLIRHWKCISSLMRLPGVVEVRVSVDYFGLVQAATQATQCRHLVFTIPSHEWSQLNVPVPSGEQGNVASAPRGDGEGDGEEENDDEKQRYASTLINCTNQDNMASDSSVNSNAVMATVSALERITIEAHYATPAPTIDGVHVRTLAAPFLRQGGKCKLNLIGFHNVIRAECLDESFDVTVIGSRATETTTAWHG